MASTPSICISISPQENISHLIRSIPTLQAPYLCSRRINECEAHCGAQTLYTNLNDSLSLATCNSLLGSCLQSVIFLNHDFYISTDTLLFNPSSRHESLQHSIFFISAISTKAGCFSSFNYCPVKPKSQSFIILASRKSFCHLLYSHISTVSNFIVDTSFHSVHKL